MIIEVTPRRKALLTRILKRELSWCEKLRDEEEKLYRSEIAAGILSELEAEGSLPLDPAEAC